MQRKFSKFQLTIKAALDESAAEMGLIGNFLAGKRHDKYRLLLPDNSVLTLPVYKSPACDATTYAVLIKKSLRRMVQRHIERAGKS